MNRTLIFVCVLGVITALLAVGIWKNISSSVVPTSLENEHSNGLPLWSPRKESATAPTTVSILFGGDLMFDRHIRQNMEKFGVDQPFVELRETLQSYDMVVANLEGPITTFPSKSVGSAVGSTNNFLFTFDSAVAPLLKTYNFSLVSLANNHIRNFGVDGITQTKAFLIQAQVEFFGNTGEETTSAQRVNIVERAGKKLAFVGANQFVQYGFETGIEDVKYAKEHADLVIVMPHWGNEYQPNSGAVIEAYAHQLVDAGADLIIGSHPHVIQQVEEYKGKKIYYSLGNFVFDQYFEEAVKKGLLIGVEIDADNAMKFTEIPIQLLPNGQTTPME